MFLNIKCQYKKIKISQTAKFADFYVFLMIVISGFCMFFHILICK